MSKNRRIFIKSIAVFLSLFMEAIFLTGCYDNVQIDKSAFISTIAIEPGVNIKEANNFKELNPNEGYQGGNKEILKVSFGFPDIRNLDTKKASAKLLSINTGGYSITDAYFKAMEESSRNINFGHTKLLIISDELFNYPTVLNEVLDYFQREASINRTMQVVVVTGGIAPYMNLENGMEENVEAYITGLLSGLNRKGTIKPVSLNDYIKDYSNKRPNYIPYLSLNDKRLGISGVAVVKENKLYGKLDTLKIADLNILKGTVENVKKVVYKSGHPLDYFIKKVDSKCTPVYKDGKLTLNYKIIAEGDISGYYSEADMLDENFLKEVKGNLEKSMDKELKDIAVYVKDTMKVDAIDAQDIIRRYHPSMWKKVQDNWEQVYNQCDINVEVRNLIRNVGISN